MEDELQSGRSSCFVVGKELNLQIVMNDTQLSSHDIHTDAGGLRGSPQACQGHKGMKDEFVDSADVESAFRYVG